MATLINTKGQKERVKIVFPSCIYKLLGGYFEVGHKGQDRKKGTYYVLHNPLAKGDPNKVYPQYIGTVMEVKTLINMEGV